MGGRRTPALSFPSLRVSLTSFCRDEDLSHSHRKPQIFSHAPSRLLGGKDIPELVCSMAVPPRPAILNGALSHFPVRSWQQSWFLVLLFCIFRPKTHGRSLHKILSARTTG